MRLSRPWKVGFSTVWNGNRKQVIVFNSCSLSCSVVDLFTLGDSLIEVFCIESDIRAWWDPLFLHFRQELDLWCSLIALVPFFSCYGWSSRVRQAWLKTLGRPESVSATWPKWFQTSAWRESVDHSIWDWPSLFSFRPYSVYASTRGYPKPDPTQTRVWRGLVWGWYPLGDPDWYEDTERIDSTKNRSAADWRSCVSFKSRRALGIVGDFLHTAEMDKRIEWRGAIWSPGLSNFANCGPIYLHKLEPLFVESRPDKRTSVSRKFI